jgi:TonB family protein
VGNGVSRPRPIYNPEPDLSKEPKADKYNGETLVAEVTIRQDGNIHGAKVYARIREAKVVRSIGDADLDARVIETMRTWIFEPCLKDQKPVSCKINVEIVIHIR